MNKVSAWVRDPRNRKAVLVLASGTLILAGMAVGTLPGGATARHILETIAAIIAGYDIAARAIASLRNRHASIELLVTIATVGALVIGETWEAAAVTFLFVLGAYLEARTLTHTRKVLQELLDLAPTTAIVMRAGQQMEVMPHEVEPDEIVWIKPGAKVAVDGEVVEGRSAVDESAITGEPMPEDKELGDKVFAGTVNGAGLIKVRATGIGADTTLARIIRRVEEAQEAKAPAQRFIERFARWYTPAIIVLSIVVYLISRDIELALTLLVISCPGALVISMPVSIVAGIGRAAKRGILIKGGEYLENAGKISALAMDKTGTLTAGKPRLTDIIALEGVLQPAGAAALSDYLPATGATNGWQPQQLEVLRWAGAAESGSEHPLATAIHSEAERLGMVLPAGNFETFTGRGVQAEVDGRAVLVGSQAFLEGRGVEVSADAEEALSALKADGKTAVLAALDGQTLGVLGISDPIRPAAAEVVAELKRSGLKRIVMLTGDDRLTAEAVARQAGIDDVRAGLLPEEKLDAIRELQREGHVVAMIGDGINDAPALAAADIGIAMGAAGTDVAIETAGIALMADDLHKIPEAVRLSKATLNNIRQNVVIALATVTLLLAGVLFGKVHMASGMLIHEASVLIVILNGMRLLRV